MSNIQINPEYDVAALKAGIEKARANIKIFREAIAKEMTTIEEYEFMIEVIERKKGE